MLAGSGFLNVSEALKAGVYLLTYKGEVVYVGKSRELLRRLYEHRLNYLRFKSGKKGHPYSKAKAILFDGIMIRPCNPHDLDRLEREYIHLYNPKHNSLLKGSKKITTPIELNINGSLIVLNDLPPAPPRPDFVRRV